MFKHVFSWVAIEDEDRLPFGRMRAIVDHTNEIGGLYIQCKEELHNWIRNSSRIWGIILANLWPKVA